LTLASECDSDRQARGAFQIDMHPQVVKIIVFLKIIRIFAG